jgi:ketopantoate reductase
MRRDQPLAPIGIQYNDRNTFAKTLKPRHRKSPLRYVQKKIRTEVDFTLAYVVEEGEKLGMKMPLCSKLLEIFRELEAGKRQFGQRNYDELVVARR